MNWSTKPWTRHWLKAAPVVWLLLAVPAVAAPTVQEFTIPTDNANAQDLVLGPDGNIWFAERGISKIGRISASNPGTIDEFPTKDASASPDIMIVGPGKIWFTEQSNNSIGRIDSSNPTAPDSFGGLGLIDPRGIAVGPDGNLWVSDADASGNKVVLVSPAGTLVDTVPLPAAFNARNIAQGPDGNMWIAGFANNKIARITVSGTTRTLDPPNGFDVPGGVTPLDLIAGSDGNIWYTAQGTTVGRMTPSGTATNFTSQGVDPFGITIGPDGAVWYAEFQADAVGRVDFSNGSTTHITGMTTGAGPRYVTSGPGDSLWFTEDNGNRVGRVTGIPLPQPPGGGPGGGGNPLPPDTTKPDVTKFGITRHVFRVGGRGAVIRWSLSEDAKVRIRFARRVRGRFRTVKRKMTFQSTAGNHRLRFRGRFDLKHPLKVGRYRMTLTAKDVAGNVSTPDRARFRLLPARKRR
jgi:streptogramin lyase